MKTIDERARECIELHYSDSQDKACLRGAYAHGATEQKEIDIRDAMWAFWEVIAPLLPNNDIAEEVSDKWLKLWRDS